MKAYNQAKLVEKSLSLQRTSSVPYHRTTSPILPNPKPNFSQPYRPNPPKHFPAKPFTKPTRMLTSAEMEERRSKGLCYWCEEKYMPGHNCRKGKQLYLYEVDEEEEEEPQEEEYREVHEANIEEGDGTLEGAQVSVHALSRVHDYRTMRVRGSSKGKVIHILIDTGSTHNFLDYETANRLGCPLEVIPAVSVAVANGTKIKCSHISGGFSWKMQSVEFSSDMLILTLGGMM
ncbi:hypothetical protein KY290_027885 [Solanum tuberosum]|uniref:Gag-pol polyprotein n=1 Tax=Solanum tuberosum TaxID=4113 RepID=A0ABQ7UGD2_SOLTU|nr:hypothetical protein KY290_027885 [Solanum tuberosum]